MDEPREAHHQDPKLTETIDEVQELLRARIKRLHPDTVVSFRAGPKESDDTRVWWWNSFRKTWNDNGHWMDIFGKSGGAK
ncbi:hypothetical protein ACQPYK_28385 [Streptosporangium sp. CA-135522]|uniref:hypothetical protein n=1 Tax=Streptosporangium sp. CA-135522 TaxID=3240072 RepID=UPI003D934560